MNIDMVNLLIVGLVAIMVALVFLLMMIHKELGPLSMLAGRKRWLLGTALGSGVLAFSLKLLLIIGIAYLPDIFITPLLEESIPQRHTRPVTGSITTPQYRWTPLAGTETVTRNSVSATDKEYVWETLPSEVPAPTDNPITPDKVALGKRLFFDPNLSRDGTISCSSCHNVLGTAGADARPTSLGIDRQLGPRNAPTVWNTAFQAVLFWDGRASSLEQQAIGPLTNPKEMGMPSLAAVEKRVRENTDYRDAFTRAFGSGVPVTITRIAEAIASYERTLITTDTPYDRFVRGDLDALNKQQLRGMALFQSVGCINCHYGPNFSAASVFDTSLPYRPFPALPIPEQVRYDLTSDTGAANKISGRGVWRVPSLRNVALTGPWLHNGSVNELAEVVRIMSRAQLGYTGRYLVWSDQDRVLRERTRPAIEEKQINDIVAFLTALSSDRLLAEQKREMNH